VNDGDAVPRRVVDTASVSVDEAAAMIGVGRGSIYSMLRDGRLTRVKIGRRTVIPVESVKALVARIDSPK
jgi:excisionase family DNA binding protein